MTLQFSFSNAEVIPNGVKILNHELPQERENRKSVANGELIISPTEKCSLLEFLQDAKDSGYQVVDAFYQRRIDAKDPSGKHFYHMVRFLFVPQEFVIESDELKAAQRQISDDLQSIVQASLWRVRVFDNPYFCQGELIPGERSLSVNLEVRVPLFRPNGEPVVSWKKDEAGNRIGEAALPISPDFHLRIKEGSKGSICLEQ